MSAEQASVAVDDAIAGKLYPKALINHISKLPGFGDSSYADLVAQVDGVASPDDPRIAELIGSIDEPDLAAEALALRLTITDQEDEVRACFPDKIPDYDSSDYNQITVGQDPRGRTLAYFLREGLGVVIEPDDKERARTVAAQDDRDVPLIEKLKAERIMTINGFANSRVMYLVHDMIDHAWLFDHLNEQGVFARYGDFLDSIDMNIDTAFLYSRQSELLSTVGFGSRRWMLAQDQNEHLVMTDGDIEALLGESDDPRTAEALSMFNGMTEDNRATTRFVVENMAIQLADERRRWGAVKQEWPGGDRQQMRLLDPLHISLLIESCNAVQQCVGYTEIQIEAIARVNQMLKREIHTLGSSALFMQVPRSTEGDERTEMSADDDRWIRERLDFSTSYNRVD